MRPLVVTPTYDERENLPHLVEQVLAQVPHAHLLVVDDGSPDGTGELADALAAADPRVHVLHRTSKDGLGRAYLAGFRWALARDYTHVCEMDADLSHRPQDLPRLLQAAAIADGVEPTEGRITDVVSDVAFHYRYVIGAQNPVKVDVPIGLQCRSDHHCAGFRRTQPVTSWLPIHRGGAGAVPPRI